MFGLEFTRNQKLALCAIAGLAVIAISIKLARSFALGPQNGVALYEPGQGVGVTASDSDPMNGPNEGKVIFHITGSIKFPNVYSLPRGNRIIDAIKAAGGARTGADLESLNLAAKIEDGSKIYVPSIEERSSPSGNAAVSMPTVTPPVSASGASMASGSTSAATSAASTSKASSGDKLRNPGEGTVNINSAGADELQRLPGVGPSTAEKIIDYRRQIGRFAKPEQIMDVKGIGPKKYEKMRLFITI